MIETDTPWDAIAELVSRLRDPEFSVRRDAGARLGEWGAKAVPALRAELRAGHRVSGPSALRALGGTGAPSAADLLLDFDPAGDPDLAAARNAGLCQLALHLAPNATAADIRALVRMLDALSEPFPSVAVTVARALQRLAADPYPHAVLREALPTLRRPNAPPAFAEAARTIEDRVVRISGAPEPPPVERVPLPRFRTEIEELRTLLRIGDHATRKAAGERLAALGAEGVAPLAAELALRHPLGCPRALAALGQTGAVDAIGPLTGFRPENADESDAHTAALTTLAGLLAARTPTAEETLAWVQLLGALPPFTPEAARIARSLDWLSRHAPTPALRAALKPLKGSLLHPVPGEFRAIRASIDRATAAWKNLPIPALAPPADPDGLPIPAEKPDA